MKARYIGIHVEILLDILKGNFPRGVTVINPLPQDTMITSIGHDRMGRMYAIVNSSEFDEQPEHTELPEHVIQFHKD